MSLPVDPTPAPAPARDAGDDPALAQLLNDVARIAEGADGMRHLAVEVLARQAPPAPTRLDPDEERAMDCIEAALIAATLDQRDTLRVPTRLLATVYRIAAETTVRR